MLYKRVVSYILSYIPFAQQHQQQRISTFREFSHETFQL